MWVNITYMEHLGNMFPCFPIIVWAVLNHDCLEPRTIMTEIYHGHFYRRLFPCSLARKVITARPEKMMLGTWKIIFQIETVPFQGIC